MKNNEKSIFFLCLRNASEYVFQRFLGMFQHILSISERFKACFEDFKGCRNVTSRDHRRPRIQLDSIQSRNILERSAAGVYFFFQVS